MRKKSEVKKVNWKVWIPVPIAEEVETIFYDPLTNAPQKGAKTKLFTTLLREWLWKRRVNPPADHELSKALQFAKVYNAGALVILRKLLPILIAHGYTQTASTIEELYVNGASDAEEEHRDNQP